MESTLENGDDKLMASHQDDPADESIDVSSKLDDSYKDDSFESTVNSENNVTVIFNPGAGHDDSFESNCTINSESNVTVIHIPGDDAAVPEDDANNTPIADKKYDGKDSKDGSDSGVEGCAAELTRVQSRNSVDYASSCNGLDEASCDSSLVSCCSVYEDPCATLPDDCRLNGTGTVAVTCNAPGTPAGGEGTSEGGSESSSVAGGCNVTARKRTGAQSNKKKLTAHSSTDSQKSCAKTKACTATVNGTTSTGARAKPRTTTPRTNTLTKQQSSTTTSSSTTTTAREGRGRTRDKSLSKDATGRDSSASGLSSRATSSTAASRSRTIRPDTLPSALTTEINKDLLAQRRKTTATSRQTKGGSSSRTSTVTQTPSSTPSEDGRKSLSTASRSTSLYASRLDMKNSRIFDKMTQSADGCKILDTYGTLPRSSGRLSSKFSVPKTSMDKPPVAHRSRSGSRDASLNRLLGKKAMGSKDTHKGLPPYQKPRPTQTKIYHEICSQTGLTGTDIDNCIAGKVTILPNPADAEKMDDVSQTEGSWEDMKQLKVDLKKVTDENEERKKENEKLKAEVEDLRKKWEEEKADHAFARQELDKNAKRVLAMLGTPVSEHAKTSDSFLELESHFQSSGQVVASQQVEIADLQSLARMLSRDLEKSIAAQKTLLQQQQEMEAESIEIREFLEEEKATLEIALKESESESKKKDERIKQLSSELEQQTEECKHLVRISEQRRQENLSLSMKLKAVDRRSKELLLAQGAAVSGASVALSGLGGRLAGLIDQLIVSYNISDKDFEDVIYHNEAFSRSNSSIESSPVSSKHSLKDCTPSPKRGSFVSAVIGAIRNAATQPFASKPASDKKSSDSSKAIQKDLSVESTSDLLDSETEPCLMMESVLDVPLHDTYSHNMVSSCDSLTMRRVLSVPESVDDYDFRRSKLNGESSSLTNLTQAILNRRRVEDEEEENYDSISESENGPSDGLPLTDYCTATSLVDQVIDVDNLVTKLLKVLRVIQIDNDTCIQELKDEKTELELRLEIFMADRKNAEISRNEEIENLNNGVNDETLIIENGDHVIKDVSNAAELIVNGQLERNKCISEEPNNEGANATVFLSSSVCS